VSVFGLAHKIAGMPACGGTVRIGAGCAGGKDASHGSTSRYAYPYRPQVAEQTCCTLKLMRLGSLRAHFWTARPTCARLWGLWGWGSFRYARLWRGMQKKACGSSQKVRLSRTQGCREGRGGSAPCEKLQAGRWGLASAQNFRWKNSSYVLKN
jgi:hypothetical protein